MSIASIAKVLLVTGTVMAICATLLAIVFKREGVSFLDESSSTFALLRHPQAFVRPPYARLVQLIGAAALVSGGVSVLLLVVFT